MSLFLRGNFAFQVAICARSAAAQVTLLTSGVGTLLQ